MSHIRIDLDTLDQLTKHSNQRVQRVASLHREAVSTRNSIDPAIASRRGISSRFYQAIQSLHELEGKLHALQSFMRHASEQYGKAEDLISVTIQEMPLSSIKRIIICK